jgi:hypothetical protein
MEIYYITCHGVWFTVTITVMIPHCHRIEEYPIRTTTVRYGFLVAFLEEILSREKAFNTTIMRTSVPADYFYDENIKAIVSKTNNVYSIGNYHAHVDNDDNDSLIVLNIEPRKITYIDANKNEFIISIEEGFIYKGSIKAITNQIWFNLARKYIQRDEPAIYMKTGCCDCIHDHIANILGLELKKYYSNFEHYITTDTPRFRPDYIEHDKLCYEDRPIY